MHDYVLHPLRLSCLAPLYITELVSTVAVQTSRPGLRSADMTNYVQPRTRTKFGERAFSYAGPAAWNLLPDRRPPASAICRYWSSTGSTRSDSHWAAEFRRQRTYCLEQSATSTTFAGSVAEHLQAGTEDASLLIRPATLSRFQTLPLLINLPTYLLTYLDNLRRTSMINSFKRKLKTYLFIPAFSWFYFSFSYYVFWHLYSTDVLIFVTGAL